MKRIKFQGKEWILVNDPNSNKLDGPIATEQQYVDFDCPYAHLFPDGIIKRFGEQIGTIDDIEVLPDA